MESVAGARALATSYSGLKAAKSPVKFFRLFEEPEAALEVRFGGIFSVPFQILDVSPNLVGVAFESVEVPVPA